MHRVVNYHSSWARQRQVELFDPSGIRVLYHGNPGLQLVVALTQLVVPRRLGLRDAGIDQLNFHSVQLDYLMLLQMGNTDPNKTKAGNKYEVKPQYEELSKQINMQQAINQCYECMRLSRESSQLDRCNNRQIISCRLYTMVYQPGNHRHDPPVGQSQRGTQSGYQIEFVNQAQDLQNHANPTARSILRSYTSTQALTTKNRAQTTRNAHPTAHASRRTREQTFLKSFELQQPRVSTTALKQRLKWVANERVKQGESSATKVFKNRGWMRWESAVEIHGEQ
ncbi:hypothetical protein F511_18836 [Dorcoceras hygrometricum]|uniref:Uncharacterized protein n=1 Tax=Dorcoceras hygrometricum TaxID=472368 RepID=A0A2Z7D9R8_9LAMI|nr:hypothetical protein F511_18836 [Dorcoceras hygrometricum]